MHIIYRIRNQILNKIKHQFSKISKGIFKFGDVFIHLLLERVVFQRTSTCKTCQNHCQTQNNHYLLKLIDWKAGKKKDDFNDNLQFYIYNGHLYTIILFYVFYYLHFQLKILLLHHTAWNPFLNPTSATTSQCAIHHFMLPPMTWCKEANKKRFQWSPVLEKDLLGLWQVNLNSQGKKKSITCWKTF